MVKFVIIKRTNGNYQFSLKAPNSRTILVSEEYPTKVACKAAIGRLKDGVADGSCFYQKRDRDGAFSFDLVAGKQEILGHGVFLENETLREEYINVVKQLAPNGAVVDQSLILSKLSVF